MERKNHLGFTIIELMLTLVIGGILLAVAVPSYTNMVMNNCLTTKTNLFIGALQLARSTAITFRDDVTVGALPCSLSGGTACDTSDEFGVGLVVFRDIDGDGLADTNVEDTNGDGVLDAGEDLNGNGILDLEIIRQIRFNCAATMNETVDLVNDTIDNSTAVVYEPNGAANPLVTIDVCDTRASAAYSGRRITLSATGRPHTESAFTCP